LRSEAYGRNLKHNGVPAVHPIVHSAIYINYMGNGNVLQYLKKERGKLVPPDDADCSVV